LKQYQKYLHRLVTSLAVYRYCCTPCYGVWDDNTDAEVSPTIRDPLSMVESMFTLLPQTKS
jgi:hypothetical protein